MAFIVKSDGKTYGTYNSCYESIRVAESLRAKGHKVERIATNFDRQPSIKEPKGNRVLTEQSRKIVGDWVERMKDLNIGHNSPMYYERKKKKGQSRED